MTPRDDDDSKDGFGDGLEKAFGDITQKFSDKFNSIVNPGAGGNTVPKQDYGLFFRAVKNNKLDVVRKFLEAGINPDMPNPSGDRALHIAARENLADMAKILIAAGADPALTQESGDKQTPLEHAVNFGKTDVAAVLAREGGYIEGRKISGWGLIHLAAKKGKPDMVKALLDAGANPNEQTENGSTPLMIAIQLKMTPLALTLLDYPDVVAGMNSLFNQTDDRKRTAFQLAVERADPAVIAKMSLKGANFNVADATGVLPLHQAIARGDAKLIQPLAQGGADLHKFPMPPLVFAALCPDIREGKDKAAMMDELIYLGADPDAVDPKTGLCALSAALLSENGAAAAALLIRQHVHMDIPDREGATPIFHAIRGGQSDTAALSQMIAAKANLDIRHRHDDRTALIHAVRQNNPMAVTLLLAAGANPRLADAHGKTALYYARQSKNAIIRSSLEKALADDLVPKITTARPAKSKGQDFDL